MELKTAKTSADNAINGKTYFAIIDIGSNSVRLVTYSGLKRVPEIVFNEKVLCGLGEEVGRTGKLSKKAMNLAYSTLKRFSVLCKHAGIKEIYPLATAAIRDASNGPDFVQKIKEEIGLNISIIDGKEEGRLSGLGVISSEGSAHGLMGDLGGGSLELAILNGRDVSERVSLPIGPLRLIAEFGDDTKAMKAYLKETLSRLDLKKKLGHPNFYMVGGAWRNIMKMMIAERSTPIPLLQGFRTNAKNMNSYCRRLISSKPSDLPYRHLISGRRLELMPVAALILKEVLKAFKIKDCKASTYGLREGYVFDNLTEAMKSKDPFLSVCKELARERSRFAEHSRLLYDWTSGLFKGGKFDIRNQEDRLHLAICYLSDIAWRGHPDYRSVTAVEQILQGNFVGLTHEDRAYVAIAVNEAYGAPINSDPIRQVIQMLPMKQIVKARIVGAGLRLAHRLSGGTSHMLQESSISVTKSEITLRLRKDHQDLANNVVRKRLANLSQLMAKTADITYTEN
ncbi:Ppx/GppA family phosphatase [Temperatibacter marinus]|uniref:Ppx/GppA family phosphatase n=1 Tax=Temperatibacter marinus TaxID=1456591 RepID=A0AA52H8J1_9PROT|nr:Ppx/GppA family phosphatase [Temperatibacter marinus]WND02181.1 Ppx/GppA family phosphatase [Temperatibacter marinus]